jgi:hypothetical protein
LFLFENKRCSVSTIKGYRAAISNTLKFSQGSEIGSDPHLADLIKYFELQRPVTRSLTPRWNLSCVLWSLTKTPYEPLSEASFQDLTLKTVFLLALASARRRSEIHALSVDTGCLRFNGNFESVSLLCQPGFLAKNQLPAVAPSPIEIPSLSRICAGDDQDRLLCPVRALRFYLNASKVKRKGRKRLFLPLKGSVDISASTISRWIVTTIKRAYQSLTDRDLSFMKLKAHEVRAVAASWAYLNHSSLEDVMKAAFWRSHTTFSSFYLRSLAHQSAGIFSLGPIVAAQHVAQKDSSK